MTKPSWKDISAAIETDFKRHVDAMTRFGSDITMMVDGKPLDTIPTKLFVNEIDVDTGAITEVTYTTQLVIDDPIEPLDEQQQKFCDWWAERWEREFLRQLLGEPSEYEQSLRAAGAKV
jgi:hypothetical protein